VCVYVLTKAINRGVQFTHLIYRLTVKVNAMDRIKVFPCTHRNCSKNYLTQACLKRHITSKHGIPKQKTNCQYCFRKILIHNLNIHMKRVHPNAVVADQENDVHQIDQDVVSEKRDTPTMIVEQFINYLVSGQTATNPMTDALIRKTKKAINKDYRHFIVMGNVFKLAIKCNAGNKPLFLEFVDELAGTMKHDLGGSEFDFEWMTTIFAVGRELLRRVPACRVEVAEMLIYLLQRAENDLVKVGGDEWDAFLNK